MASSASHVEIPLFGINLGTVGFLTEGEITNWQTIIDRLLAMIIPCRTDDDQGNSQNRRRQGVQEEGTQ